jgi:predicted ABC-type ATPase
MSEPAQRPLVVVIGGPNGAGKTTSASRFLPRDLDVRRFVNADVIAQGLAGFAPETVAIEAGRIMLMRLDELARQRHDFAFESTLSARSFATFLRRLRDEGYEVRVVYVWVRSSELSVQRVAERVRRGGHHIPQETIRRRYGRGARNFWRLYRPLADVWVLCDNSGAELIEVARGTQERVTAVYCRELYDEFERATDCQPQPELAD